MHRERVVHIEEEKVPCPAPEALIPRSTPRKKAARRDRVSASLTRLERKRDISPFKGSFSPPPQEQEEHKIEKQRRPKKTTSSDYIRKNATDEGGCFEEYIAVNKEVAEPEDGQEHRQEVGPDGGYLPG